MKEHFSEILLVIVLIIMLGFTVGMNRTHNDALASSGKDFAGQALAALLTLMVASKQSAPAPGTTTSTTASTSVPTVAPPIATSQTPPPAPQTLPATPPAAERDAAPTPTT